MLQAQIVKLLEKCIIWLSYSLTRPTTLFLLRNTVVNGYVKYITNSSRSLEITASPSANGPNPHPLFQHFNFLQNRHTRRVQLALNQSRRWMDVDSIILYVCKGNKTRFHQIHEGISDHWDTYTCKTWLTAGVSQGMDHNSSLLYFSKSYNALPMMETYLFYPIQSLQISCNADELCQVVVLGSSYIGANE